MRCSREKRERERERKLRARRGPEKTRKMFFSTFFLLSLLLLLSYLEVGRRARQRLHVDAPLRRVEAEGRQGALLAEGLGLVDELVAAVVAGA